MSKKYIECEAAKEQIRAHIIIGEPKTNVGLKLAVEAIDEVPVADVGEVRHGRWIKDCDLVMGDGWTYTRRHCSECGWQTVECVNYCQYCGAKMDLPEPPKEET